MQKRMSGLLIWALVVACALLTSPVFANENCSDEERIAFQADVEAGIPMEELVQIYAQCADPASLPVLTSEAGVPDKTIMQTATASVFYEQMNGCGYHPQIRVAACDVEVKRTTWYGPFGPPPNGSFEYVTFCFGCGGGWIPVLGSVHVTNDTSGAPPSWGFMAYATAPTACPAGGTGISFPIRATLSWATPAANPCTTTPMMIWGNQITFDTRDDP